MTRPCSITNGTTSRDSSASVSPQLLLLWSLQPRTVTHRLASGEAVGQPRSRNNSGQGLANRGEEFAADSGAGIDRIYSPRNPEKSLFFCKIDPTPRRRSDLSPLLGSTCFARGAGMPRSVRHRPCSLRS